MVSPAEERRYYPGVLFLVKFSVLPVQSDEQAGLQSVRFVVNQNRFCRKVSIDGIFAALFLYNRSNMLFTDGFRR
jgi:uncharacterized membrane protein YiaA